MLVKFIQDEDFVNYKKPAMFIGFPTCTFKCEKECGCSGMCQNTELTTMQNIDIEYEDIVKRYLDNSLTKAIVFGGLEPFDSLPQLDHLVKEFRKHTDDDIVIYTGYTEEELKEYPYYITYLQRFPNIIIKFGRYIPNQEKHFDSILGVKLASSNQYAKCVGDIKV
jgi:organic radical activating enzyme